MDPSRVVEPVRIAGTDGVVLEGEFATAEPAGELPIAGAVLCHPHPQYGGTMRSLVIGALFAAFPAAGVTCLRFNFRGVEGSGGAFDSGRGEVDDARAALATLAAALPAETPLVLAGWSFGADVALSVRDAAVTAWLAIAPPLRYTTDLDGLATDPRPKLLLLAEHDEVRDPAEVEAIAGGWPATDVEVIAGASHFFMGRTDRVAAVAVDYARGVLRRG